MNTSIYKKSPNPTASIEPKQSWAPRSCVRCRATGRFQSFCCDNERLSFQCSRTGHHPNSHCLPCTGETDLTHDRQHGEVIIDGKRLEALWCAPVGDRPTIVMLHEGLGSIALWKDLPWVIAEATGCGILLYSRYGHGKSDGLREGRAVEYLHHEATVVLPALLEQFGLQEPILLGHSDGASISLIYAGLFPESPRAIIVEAPHVFVEDVTVEGVARARSIYLTTDLPSRLGRYHDHADELFWGWNDIWLDPTFRRWNIEEYLAAIRCPVLVLQGEDDEYGTAAQAKAIGAAVPQAEVILLPNCGHAPHFEQPEITLAYITEFVRRLVPQQGGIFSRTSGT